MKKTFLLTLTLSFVFILSACFHKEETPADETQKEPPSADETSASPTQTYRIDMTAEGFSPSEITIKVGDTVNFVNTDTESHWPASAMHPTHLLLPGFDAIGGVEPGSTYAYTFTKAGAWGFHDHLNSERFGKIIVTE